VYGPFDFYMSNCLEVFDKKYYVQLIYMIVLSLKWMIIWGLYFRPAPCVESLHDKVIRIQSLA